MEKQREEQVNKLDLQENMDTLRDERDTMESKLNDIIVHTKDDNVQQERIDNFDSNWLDTIAIRSTSIDAVEAPKAPIMVTSIPVGVQTPATVAESLIQVDSIYQDNTYNYHCYWL